MEIYKKLLNIIDKSFHVKIYFLIILISISMVLEMISIGMLIPFFEIILTNEENLLIKLFNYMNFKKENMFQISLILLAFIFLIKTIVISFIIYFKHKFILNFNINLASRITEKITSFNQLSIKDNTSDYHRLILIDVSMVSNSIYQIINIVSESTIIIGSIIILLYYEPFLLSLFIFFSILVYFLYKLFLKNRIIEWGDLRKINDTNRRKSLNDLLHTNTFAKLLGLKNISFAKFSNSNNSTLNYYQLREMWNELPRGFLELIAIIFIIIIFSYLIVNNIEIIKIIPILSLFTLASLKIIMSINRLIIAFNQIFFAKTSIGKIDSYLSTNISTPNKSNKSKLANLQNLRFENVYFSYDKKKNVINNLSFNINKNDLIGIKGRSGSGKTTLIHIITGLLNPKKGKVILNKKFDYKNKKLNFGLVSQKPFILNETLKRNIAFGLDDKKIDETKVKKLIKLMELNDLSDSSSKVLDYLIAENASNISLGQAQRISIARCLYFNPDILILDEPTSSLDKKNENSIFNILKKLKSKKTIILVSHNKIIYKFCSKIIDLDNNIHNQ